MTVVHKNSSFDQQRVIVSRTTMQRYVRDGEPIPKPPLGASTIDLDALATLLYSGTVYPPSTIYHEYAAVGMGGQLTLTGDGSLTYTETYDLFARPDAEAEEVFDPIDELTRSLDSSGIGFDNAILFLSEGKDSVSIALALAELGIHIDCVTFANCDSNVAFVEKLAARLGHRLSVVRYETMKISDCAIDRLGRVFEPTLDQAFLSYLLLPGEMFEGRTLIEGGGNDVYMGHLPSKHQRRATYVCNAVEGVVPQRLRNYLKSRVFTDTSRCGVPFRTFTECQGAYNGLDEELVSRSTGGAVRRLTDLDANWKSLGFERARALSRGRYVVPYSYSGKTIALAEMVQGRASFPWADEQIAQRFARQRDEDRFHWPNGNKLSLRQAISKRLDYSQPKVGFRAPIQEILDANSKLFEHAIGSSQLLGAPLVQSLSATKSASQRYAAGLLLALWELASTRSPQSPSLPAA